MSQRRDSLRLGIIPFPVDIFLRSLLIQASFNFRGMQNLGVAFSLLPLVKYKLIKERAADFLKKHMVFFNTHPYFSSPILATIARLEVDGERTDEVKKILGGPYAAIGDAFFWGALKPLGAVCAVLIALLGSNLAPLTFLLLYNVPHLWLRVGGFIYGYRGEKDGIEFIGTLNLPKTTLKIRYIIVFILPLVILLSTRSVFKNFSFNHDVYVLILTILLFYGMKRGIPRLKMIYGLFLVSTLLLLW